MDEIIQIKCPFDGAVLSVRNQPGIETKNVTCPICKNKYPFTHFKKVVPAAMYAGSGASDEHTRYEAEYTSYAQPQKPVGESPDMSIGKVTVVDSGLSYQLQPGRNIIGRKASHSSSDFQIDTGMKRAMSREHVLIEVKNEPTKGYVHYLSLYKQKVNKTYVGAEELLYGDCIVLRSGDLIKLPDATLKFERK